jgi:protocatechuate 3,4-dioxygenase alpha subunit
VAEAAASSPGATPSQTAGPFVSIGTEWAATGFMVSEAHPGAVVIEGRILDGAGVPVADAMAEFWQADQAGLFPPESEPPWSGFARLLSGPGGEYRLVTLKPGRVRGPRREVQAPHIDVSVFARGLLQRLVTRIYFSDEGAANTEDPVLRSLPDATTAGHLVAALVTSAGECPPRYHFDMFLQGERQTPFFAPW